MALISNIVCMMHPLYDLQLHPVKGNIDAKHLKLIHKIAMDDMYPWGGTYREHPLWRFPASDFDYPDEIPEHIDFVFDEFKKSQKDLATKCAILQWKLNRIHPFSDGNGRTQRELIREICLEDGYIFDLSFTTIKDMFTASRSDTPDMLITIFKQAIRPHPNPQQFYENCDYITILSQDDVPQAANQYFKTHSITK